VDVIDIVTPTLSHYKCAKLPSNQNTFYRKPISNTIEEAEEIITLANEYNVKGQVGHVERFNPAFIATKKT
jgi:predicted dehydrogenase